MPDRSVLSDAFRLTCACITWPRTPQDGDATAALAGSVRDWNEFLGFVKRHRVEGLAAEALRDIDAVPKNVRDILFSAAREIAGRNLLSVAALTDIAQSFDTEGIPYVTLKGLPLAILAYGGIASRHSKDIDILVAPAQFERACVVLRRLGYSRVLPAPDAGPNLLALWSRLRKDHTFRKAGVETELHWRPVNNPYLLAMPLIPATWRSVEVAPARLVNALGPDDMFAYLCAHGAASGWPRLKWLADIGALLREQTPAGISCLYDAACARGVARPAAQALLLCARLLHLEIPDDLKSRLASDRTNAWLERVALTSYLQEGASERSTVFLSALRNGRSRFALSRSPTFKLREITFTLSDPMDAAKTGFPDRLMVLYPLLRLAIWLYMHVKNRRSARSGCDDQRERKTP